MTLDSISMEWWVEISIQLIENSISGEVEKATKNLDAYVKGDGRASSPLLRNESWAYLNYHEMESVKRNLS